MDLLQTASCTQSNGLVLTDVTCCLLAGPMELLQANGGGLTPGLSFEGANPFEVGAACCGWEVINCI